MTPSPPQASIHLRKDENSKLTVSQCYYDARISFHYFRTVSVLYTSYPGWTCREYCFMWLSSLETAPEQLMTIPYLIRTRSSDYYFSYFNLPWLSTINTKSRPKTSWECCFHHYNLAKAQRRVSVPHHICLLVSHSPHLNNCTYACFPWSLPLLTAATRGSAWYNSISRVMFPGYPELNPPFFNINLYFEPRIVVWKFRKGRSTGTKVMARNLHQFVYEVSTDEREQHRRQTTLYCIFFAVV